MHRHTWSAWEFNGGIHEYSIDGYYRKTKYEYVSICGVCHKPRIRKFKTISVEEAQAMRDYYG